MSRHFFQPLEFVEFLTCSFQQIITATLIAPLPTPQQQHHIFVFAWLCQQVGWQKLLCKVPATVNFARVYLQRTKPASVDIANPNLLAVIASEMFELVLLAPRRICWTAIRDHHGARLVNCICGFRGFKFSQRLRRRLSKVPSFHRSKLVKIDLSTVSNCHAEDLLVIVGGGAVRSPFLQASTTIDFQVARQLSVGLGGFCTSSFCHQKGSGNLTKHSTTLTAVPKSLA